MLKQFTILSLTFGLLYATGNRLHANAPGDTLVKHSTDAVLDDWDPSAFDIHEATGIRMAADNDAEKLYLALYIVNPDVQKRMMLSGMQLFVDTKAKKREGTFVEFPVQKTPQEIALHLSTKTQTPEEVQVFREQMTGGMLFLKKTGFKNQQFDTELQAINLPNEINISFGWDERSVMYIEYEIPFTRLGGKEALLNKPLSVGIKLKSAELMSSSSQPIRTETRIVAVPANSNQGGRISQGGGSVVSSSSLRSSMPPTKPGIPEQSFWLKHEVH